MLSFFPQSFHFLQSMYCPEAAPLFHLSIPLSPVSLSVHFPQTQTFRLASCGYKAASEAQAELLSGSPVGHGACTLETTEKGLWYVMSERDDDTRVPILYNI